MNKTTCSSFVAVLYWRGRRDALNIALLEPFRVVRERMPAASISSRIVKSQYGDD